MDDGIKIHDLKNNCCVFERLFKIQNSGVFLFWNMWRELGSGNFHRQQSKMAVVIMACELRNVWNSSVSSLFHPMDLEYC